MRIRKYGLNTQFFFAKKWVNPTEKRRNIERNIPRYFGSQLRLITYSDWKAVYTAASTERNENINIVGMSTSLSFNTEQLLLRILKNLSSVNLCSGLIGIVLMMTAANKRNTAWSQKTKEYPK